MAGELTLVRFGEAADLPVGALEDLATAATAEGHGMMRRLMDEWLSGVNRFDRAGEILLGAWAEGRLIAAGGLNVDPYEEDGGIGRVRHLYVAVARRRQGVGRRLVLRIVEAARPAFHTLQLRTPATRSADAFYQACGFQPVTGHPTCTHRLDLMKTGGER